MSSSKNSSAAVDDYIAKAPAYARPICEKLRALVRKAAPELAEVIKWSMPCYSGHGLVCGIRAHKNDVTFHFFKGAELPDPDGLLTAGEGNASGKSMKLTSIADLPTKAAERLLCAAMAHDSLAKSAPAPRARRADLPMPDDLAQALKRAPKAQAYFDTLPPSSRREFIEWILTAKREETRARRLAEAIAMLSEGRRRNEQYR
jgi:uncharacterized protein YdeI (YjbR/CyaY-like superfamily)